MILYYENDHLDEQYNNILKELDNQSHEQNKKLQILLECLKKINAVIQNSEQIQNVKPIIHLLEDFKTLSEDVRENISCIDNLKVQISDISSKRNSNDVPITDELKNQIQKYNELSTNCQNKITATSERYDKFLFYYINTFQDSMSLQNIQNNVVDTNIADNINATPQVEEEPKKDTNNNSTSNNSDEKTEEENPNQNEEIKDNRVLLISETQKKVFLPYYVKDLKKQLKKTTKYKNLEELINNEYIVPLSRYNNPIISRFRETYNLMKKKEKCSITGSLELSVELAFNTLLNPAIITACKNLDELDIYLDCLRTNELEKFKFFEIKYEMLPRKIYRKLNKNEMDF